MTVLLHSQRTQIASCDCSCMNACDSTYVSKARVRKRYSHPGPSPALYTQTLDFPTTGRMEHDHRTDHPEPQCTRDHHQRPCPILGMVSPVAALQQQPWEICTRAKLKFRLHRHTQALLCLHASKGNTVTGTHDDATFPLPFKPCVAPVRHVMLSVLLLLPASLRSTGFSWAGPRCVETQRHRRPEIREILKMGFESYDFENWRQEFLYNSISLGSLYSAKSC
jgi:hypothetical protein